MWQFTKAISVAFGLTLATQSTAAVDLPRSITGDWEIVNEQSPANSQDCTRAQRFSLSVDAQEILLTEPWANFSARYRVVRVEPDRMLTIIEDDERRNDNGDPIMWWFYFSGNDTFRFRQYDWPADRTTSAVWKRCAEEMPGSAEQVK